MGLNETDAMNECTVCRGHGIVNGHYCACPVGAAWRASPRIVIGDQVLVFPPGTTREEAQSVLNEARIRHNEGLS